MSEGRETAYTKELQQRGIDLASVAFSGKERIASWPTKSTLTMPLGAACETLDDDEGNKIKFQGETFSNKAGQLRAFDVKHIIRAIIAAETGLDPRTSPFPFFKAVYEKKAGNGVIVLNIDMRDIVGVLDTCANALGGRMIGEAAVAEYARLYKAAVSTIPTVRAKGKKHGLGPGMGEKTMREQNSHKSDAIEFLQFLMNPTKR